MKEENKIFFKTFFSAGISFAFGMEFYGYLNEDDHLIWKFIIHFMLFGLTMGIISRRNYLKKQKEPGSEEVNRNNLKRYRE